MPVSDLFSPSSQGELSALSDDELIVAAHCIQRSSDEDEQDESAWRLAVMLDLAKQPSTAEIITSRAFEVVSVWQMCAAIAGHSGLFRTQSWKQDFPDSRHQDHAIALAVLQTRHAALVAHAAVSVVVARPPHGRIEFESIYESIVFEEALRVIADTQLLLEVVRRGTTLHSDVALTRLTQLTDVDALRKAAALTKRTSAGGFYDGHQRALRALERLSDTQEEPG